MEKDEPDNEKIYFNLAMLSMDDKSFDDAKKWFDKAIQVASCFVYFLGFSFCALSIFALDIYCTEWTAQCLRSSYYALGLIGFCTKLKPWGCMLRHLQAIR